LGSGVDVTKKDDDDPELKLSVLGMLRLCGFCTRLLIWTPFPPLPPLPTLLLPPLRLSPLLFLMSSLSGEERKAESTPPAAGERCNSPSEFLELSVEAALELELFSSSESDSRVLRELLYLLLLLL
jgi:hypothetical protein